MTGKAQGNDAIMKHVRRMFQLFLPLLLLAAAGCALVFWMVGREDKSQREMLSSVGFLGDTTGFLVTTGREGDFPSRIFNHTENCYFGD